MNVLTIILLVILALIALLLIVALFTRKEYTIRREVTVDSHAQDTYDYLKLQRNGEQFNTWVMRDPQMKKILTGRDGTVGFIYAWNGNKQAGKGEQEIIQLRENERIELELRFERPFKGVSRADFVLKPLGSRTHITWSFHNRMSYPMNITLLFIEKMLGKDMEESLSRLKGILDKN